MSETTTDELSQLTNDDGERRGHVPVVSPDLLPRFERFARRAFEAGDMGDFWYACRQIDALAGVGHRDAFLDEILGRSS